MSLKKSCTRAAKTSRVIVRNCLQPPHSSTEILIEEAGVDIKNHNLHPTSYHHISSRKFAKSSSLCLTITTRLRLSISPTQQPTCHPAPQPQTPTATPQTLRLSTSMWTLHNGRRRRQRRSCLCERMAHAPSHLPCRTDRLGTKSRLTLLIPLLMREGVLGLQVGEMREFSFRRWAW